MFAVRKPAALLLLGVLLVVPVYSDIPTHLVKSLPGWSGPLPSVQYSGYLRPDSTSGKELHYWFVESENDPKSDPVVLWLNGGPGCSSLDGFFNELGPLHFDRTTADNLTVPNLIRNPYSWTKIANVIFLESPAGVGYSFSSDPKTDYNIDDNQTALDNYNFLVNFFSNYQEYQANDFYIAGESYGGIYVPTLVNTIRMMNEKVTTSQQINLKGFMVGNGCVGNEVGGCGSNSGLKIHIDFYHGHALFPDALYDDIIATCDFKQPQQSDDCRALIRNMSMMIGKINIYDIYTPCYSNLLTGRTRARNHLKELVLSRSLHSTKQPPQIYYGPDECLDDHVESKYFDNPNVRDAIHVETVDKIGGWRLCTSKLNYNANTPSLIPIYPTLIQQYRTLIYNGDVDGCVPFIGNEQWTSNLGFKVEEQWRPWLVNDQVAGYVTKYDANDFTFITVKGSGHMVPQYRPVQALAMFERFIKQQPF